jgi:hypothetical protein
MLSVALPATVGGWPLHPGGDFLPLPQRRGGEAMTVTYSDLIQIGILIVGVIGLFIQATKKK